MSDSICVGCRQARWDLDEMGRPHRSRAGMCTALESAPVRIPAAFHIPKLGILGGRINRSDEWFVARSCNFKDTAP